MSADDAGELDRYASPTPRLGTMGIEEGTLFLLRRAKRLKRTSATLQVATHADRVKPRQLSRRLMACLWPSIRRSLIDETGCTLTDYLKFYTTRRKRLLRTRGHNATGHPEPVATTWSLSFEKVEQRRSCRRRMLACAPFSASRRNPRSHDCRGSSAIGTALEH